MKKLSTMMVAAAMMLMAGAVYADAPLRPGDQLDLRLGGVPGDDASSISGSYTIDGDGMINLGLINKVNAAGKTVSELQNAVERIYIDRGIFTHPTVTVSVAPNARLITVGGEVNSKGRIPYTPDMTVMSAIGAAGDFSIYANRKKVFLTRGNQKMTINCVEIANHPEKDIKVLPGDNIQVAMSLY